MKKSKKQATERRKKVEERLKGRRDQKLSSKLSAETQMTNLSKKELNLKRKMIEKFEKSDEEYNTSLQKVLKTMDNISSAIQQSVGILAHLVHHQTGDDTMIFQPNIPYAFNSQGINNRFGNTTQGSSSSQSQNGVLNQNFQQEDENSSFFYKQL